MSEEEFIINSSHLFRRWFLRLREMHFHDHHDDENDCDDIYLELASSLQSLGKMMHCISQNLWLPSQNCCGEDLHPSVFFHCRFTVLIHVRFHNV